MLLFAVPPEQCRESVEKPHEIARLQSGTLQIYTFGDDLVERPYSALDLMKYDRQDSNRTCRL